MQQHSPHALDKRIAAAVVFISCTLTCLLLLIALPETQWTTSTLGQSSAKWGLTQLIFENSTFPDSSESMPQALSFDQFHQIILVHYQAHKLNYSESDVADAFDSLKQGCTGVIATAVLAMLSEILLAALVVFMWPLNRFPAMLPYVPCCALLVSILNGLPFVTWLSVGLAAIEAMPHVDPAVAWCWYVSGLSFVSAVVSAVFACLVWRTFKYPAGVPTPPFIDHRLTGVTVDEEMQERTHILGNSHSSDGL